MKEVCLRVCLVMNKNFVLDFQLSEFIMHRRQCRLYAIMILWNTLPSGISVVAMVITKASGKMRMCENVHEP